MVRTVDNSKDSNKPSSSSLLKKACLLEISKLFKDKCTNKKNKKLVIFEVHYIWYQRKSYNTGPEQGHINRLVYILIYEKTNKSCGLQTESFSVLC
jgi:hypothetical protein